MTKLTEKLEKVSKYVEQTHDEDYQEQLEVWGRQIMKAEMMDDYRELPMTQTIVRTLVKTIKTINQKLIYGTDEDIQKKRPIYMADKQRLMWLLKILSHNYSKDLKMIEMAIDAELQELDV